MVGMPERGGRKLGCVLGGKCGGERDKLEVGSLFVELVEGNVPLWHRDKELSPRFGDVTGLMGVLPSPEMLLLLLVGNNGDGVTGFVALRDPSRLMTTSELSIRSMLCPDRMLPSRSGTGAASTTPPDWRTPRPLRDMLAVNGRATGWWERSAEQDIPRLLASKDVTWACSSSSSRSVNGSRSYGSP